MYIRLNFVVSAIRSVYEKIPSLSEHSPFLLFLHISDWVIFLSDALFLRFKVVLLRLELSPDTTIAAEIGQAVVD